MNSGVEATSVISATTNGSERMRIDSSGNVKQNSVNTSTNVGYSVNNGTYDAIALGTGGFGVNGGAATDGGIRAYNNLLFGTGASATERMRIDSSGNALFNCTTSDPVGGNVTGSALLQYGGASMSRNNTPALDLNRMTSDGEILRLRKNGTTVGSIGTHSGGGTYFYRQFR